MDEGLKHALAEKAPVAALLDLAASYFVKKSPEQRQRVQQELEKRGDTFASARPQPGITVLNPTVRGGMSTTFIRRIVERRAGELRACCANLEKQGSGGDVTLSFTIREHGEVEIIEATSSTLLDAAAVACMKQVIKRLKFATPDDGAATVILPLRLTPETSAPPP